MMKEIKLRPCPFCGKPAVEKQYTTQNGLVRHLVGCYNKECDVQPDTFWHDTLEEAAKVWNGGTTIWDETPDALGGGPRE